MAVAHLSTETFPETFRKKVLPLSQLVEEKKHQEVPHHLLETKTFAKLKSNSVIQAEPSVLHFSGFKLGQDYLKVLKLINVSSEVINIHILPTQTKYFKTKYSKKHRLVPGLSYTIKVHFCPDEWRYFYDCLRVHCKGEENLLVPVHAYPVIDDLHIPSHINLPAVPLGHSVSHTIPLSCSCPIDFEFQIYILQPHRDFTVAPLTGIIPAHGKVDVVVSFTPAQYGMSQVTLQLVISQFNSRPYVCTLCGSSSPHLALSQLEKELGHGKASSGEPGSVVPSRAKSLLRPIRTTEKPKVSTSKAPRGLSVGRTCLDVSTPAGVAKMLMRHPDKLSYRDLRDEMLRSATGLQSRQMKEASFEERVRRDVQEERAIQLRWQVRFGKDPVSARTRAHILEERETSDYECKVQRGEVRREGECTRARTELSCRRPQRSAGQVPSARPVFSLYSDSPLEVRHRALRLFQQAARKVVIRCRMNHRLVCLKQLIRNQSEGETAGEEQASPLTISSDKVLPFAFPIFSSANQPDELAPNALGPVPVRPIDVAVQTHTPFFSLQVPQHYKLMGYQPVAAYEAGSHHVPHTLLRPLRTGAQEEEPPSVFKAAVAWEPESRRVPEDFEDESSPLTFSAPAALLRTAPCHPLRIFNPAPGLHAYKATPLYLESDLEYHLCPLPRYTLQKSASGVQPPSTQKQFLTRKDVITGLMTWKMFPSTALTWVSTMSTMTSNWAPRMADQFNTDLLPAAAPTFLNGLPEDIEVLSDCPLDGCDGGLTPEMIKAEFLLPDPLTSRTLNAAPRPLKEDSSKEDSREVREQQLEASFKGQTNRLGAKVMGRLQHLKQVGKTISPPAQDNK